MSMPQTHPNINNILGLARFRWNLLPPRVMLAEVEARYLRYISNGAAGSLARRLGFLAGHLNLPFLTLTHVINVRFPFQQINAL